MPANAARARSPEKRLHATPEVSTLDFTNAAIISGFTVPALSTRRAETDIELRDGQSFGIAGLLDNRAQVQFSKVPGIGDIPILGNLFRSRSVSRSNGELLVLVTPRVDYIEVARRWTRALLDAYQDVDATEGHLQAAAAEIDALVDGAG